jgi:serine/threonine-protein kinase HipA
MGALEYAPIYKPEPFSDRVDLQALVKAVDAVLQGKEEDVLNQLRIQGGSPGGARPKVTIARSNRSDICLSGFDILPDDYSHWLVKFRSQDDPKDMGRIEQAYAEMARDAGVAIPHTELMRVSQGNEEDVFFAVQRFDRYGKSAKRHTHSLAGLLYANFRAPCMDYEGVLRGVRLVTGDHSQVTRAFRLMVFNVLAHNQDDHVKNFAFVVDEAKGWQLSPAFDLTYSVGMGGQHTTAVNGAGEPALEDVLKLGHNHAIDGALKIVGQVRHAVSKWPTTAQKWGVSEASTGLIQKSFTSIDEKFKRASLCEYISIDSNLP